jgi:multimeric flavodoxin WrbA
MKTLIFNGSPRKNGETASLVQEVVKGLSGDYKIVEAYYSDIGPCIDCRYCWGNSGCSVQDGMQEIYDYIQECDNVLIASPIHFAELTGPLLCVTGRLQTYYCARRFRSEKPIRKNKNGAVILVGGSHGNKEIPYGTACNILRTVSAHDIMPLVSSMRTDEVPSTEDAFAMAGVRSIIKVFNDAGNKRSG